MKVRKHTLAMLITAAAVLVAGCSSLPLPSQASPTTVPNPLDDFVPQVNATGEVVPEQEASNQIRS